MVSKRVVATDKAPAAVASYSQAIESDGLIFCSGQIPLDPSTGELLSGSIQDETRRVMENMKAVLEAAGSSLDGVVKVTAYLTSMDDYAGFNEAYAEYFGEEPPARAAVAVSALPKGARIEVECVARA